jgi:hypothetical protein
MKQKDYALIAILVIVSGTASLLVSRILFNASKHQLKAEVVDVITSDFISPPKKYFNAESINPTQSIQIGGSGNSNPFASGQ